MAGRVYGAEQEKSSQRDTWARQIKTAQQFARVIDEGNDVVARSFDLNRGPGRPAQKDAVKIAIDLRRISGELEKTNAIDDRSTAIKTRLIDLINKRAKAFEQAVNDSMIAAAASADREAFDAAFNDFSDWESNTAQDFRKRFNQ